MRACCKRLCAEVETTSATRKPGCPNLVSSRSATFSTRQGASLIIVIAIISSLTILSALTAKIVYNTYANAVVLYDREIAYSLAESGLVLGQARLVKNPNWISAGEKQVLGCGSFTVERAFGSGVLVSTGEKSQARVTLKRSIK